MTGSAGDLEFMMLYFIFFIVPCGIVACITAILIKIAEIIDRKRRK